MGAILTGVARPPSWRDGAPRRVDFFAIKGVLAGLLDALRVPWTWWMRASRSCIPAGRRASWPTAEPAGWLGEIHPLVAAQWDLDDTVAAFELDLDVVPVPTTPLYREVSSFPDVREDLAVVVPEHVSADELIDAVRGAGRPLLAGVDVFDVYRDPGKLGEGNKSLALRLTYRAADRTLTDEEVAERRDAIAAAVERVLGGRIRAA